MSEKANYKLPFTDLPEGTVTFLFSDIEGSTRLLKRLGEGYADLLSGQRRILRKAFSRWQGQEVDTQGDAFFVAFPRATQAVSAAVEVQRGLAEHEWPGGVSVIVRMGLHTGEPWKGEEGYVGMDVHRAARIAHVGHGGQVLLSETTAPLVKGDLPMGVSLLDLGRHRLKDLHNPEHIHQLVIEGLPFEFPPLKSLEVLPPEISLDAGAVKLPAFLDGVVVESRAPLFVGREREIARLESYLNRARNGQGGMVFVTGGSGRGKTALIQAFAQQSSSVNNDLLVAVGKCNAFTGVGDPYLPFREVLGDLSGDVEAKWTAGTISQELARRLWGICPATAQSLVENGPNLMDVFLSGEKLLSRISTAVPDQRVLLQMLRALVESQRAAPSDLDQKALFEQYSRVLCQIAEAHPLMLLLDDLQWADMASIDLLFHLGRSLAGNRILVICSYRPEEVALGRADGKHPLESVLNEFKRLFGDVWINLSQAQEGEERCFVETFLDSEPNLLGEEFREALYAHTEGHPLFTIELLREMQARGFLIRDENGRWVEGKPLDWNLLPPRVDGVIAARIGRLEDELRDILTIASVEGDDFTAQVIARLKKADERGLVRQLSSELDKVHRLVGERGIVQLAGRRLYLYRFQHHLYQTYLYNGLGECERELLHADVGAVLEEFYAGRTEEISLQLAYHYSQANEGEKAVPYLLMAGDQARNSYAHQEAIGYYQRSLAFQEELGDYGGAARTQMRLGQTYHSAFDYRRANESYAAGFSLWQRASEKQSAVPSALSMQTLRFVLRWDPFTLDPGYHDDLDTGVVIDQIFCGLLELTPEMDVVPNLAHKWEILEGGRKYLFHLREDALWSDGSPVIAEDFVFAWRRLLNPDTQSRMAELLYDIKGAKAFHYGEMSEVENLGVRACTPHTLEIELKTPAGYFLQLMAHPITYPVPHHVVERFGEDWTKLDNLVVNGPFLIESWKPGESLTLARNPKYHGRFSGNLQLVEISFIPPSDSSVQVSMYETNELDALQISYFPPAEINRLRRQHSSDYLSAPLQDILFLEFNTLRTPFDDSRVRRAFMMALDREALGPASGGAVIPALGGLIPPGIPGHSQEIGLPYNPDAARELLAQAGYPGGRGFPVVDILLWPSVAAQIEGAISHWREVLGIEHTWDLVSIIDVPKRAKEMPPHMTFQGWAADYPDPDTFLRVGFQKDLCGWQGEVFDELVERARRTQDQGERIKLYRKADKILIDEAIVLPLAYYVGHFLMKPWLINFPLSPMGSFFLKDVVVKSHMER